MERGERGWLNGLMGVIVFSGSLPATRLAVAGFPPVFLTAARAVVAAALGAALLLALRQARPRRDEMASLAVVAGGVVIGFPLLTALALRHMSSAHSTVFVGFLPLSTAIFGALRGGERPAKPFWLFSLLGGVAVAAFAWSDADAASAAGDLLMLAAIVVCGLGYAEGARLSRRLGGWQTISWALLLALPAMSLVGFLSLPQTFDNARPSAWIGLAYVSVFSMFVGFVFWYHGLAQGGVARIGQLQLLQPFLSLALAGWVLHETVAPTMIAAAMLVVACVALGRRYG